MPNLFSRADHALGRLFWRAMTVLLILVSGLCFWAGLTGASTMDGGERWAAMGIAFTAGVMFALFAWTASRKRRLSDALDDA